MGEGNPHACPKHPAPSSEEKTRTCPWAAGLYYGEQIYGGVWEREIVWFMSVGRGRSKS